MTQPDDKVEKLYIWTNPDFNEVLIFYGLQAISFRDRKKAKHLYNTIRPQLQRIHRECWPYNKPIMVTIGISGPTKMYSRRDVDNMCKVILDAGNKVIYDDDRLINTLIVQKQLWELPLYGFQIGIRVLDNEREDKYTPTMCFTSVTETGIDNTNIESPIIFHFENEADTDYIKVYSKNNDQSE